MLFVAFATIEVFSESLFTFAEAIRIFGLFERPLPFLLRVELFPFLYGEKLYGFTVVVFD